MAEINIFTSLKYCSTKSLLLTFLNPKSCVQKSLGFFLDDLNAGYSFSEKITSISISGAVMTLITSILCSYALPILKFSLRESKIRTIDILSENPFLKYRASNFFASRHLIGASSRSWLRLKISLSLSRRILMITSSAVHSQMQATYLESCIYHPSVFALMRVLLRSM